MLLTQSSFLKLIITFIWTDISFVLLELQWLSDQLWIRDVNCCNSHPIKCWRHYLNDLKTENFLLVNDQIFLDVDNLMDGWTTRTRGVSEFHLDWCVPVLDGKS